MSPTPTKILWLDPADFLGGAELFSLDVLPLLAKKSDITVLIGNGRFQTVPYKQKLPRMVEKEYFPFPQLKPVTPKNIWRFFQTARKLRKYITSAEQNFDLIHTNSIRAHTLASFALRKIPEQAKPRLVFFVHDFTFPGWAVKLFVKQADLICCCSEAVKSDLMQKGVNAECVRVIPNGVDVERFSKIPRKRFLKEKPVIGILGRIDIWKGQDIFLQAAEKVLEKYPEAQFRIFGESSAHDPKTQKFERQLGNFVAEKNLEEKVEFCGFLAPEKAFPEIDILVHASTKPEPFGRVVLEALAAGVPIIASNLGGTAEIFTDKAHGLLIPPKNPELLAQNIEALLENETWRQQFSENGKKMIVGKFALPAVVRNIENIWQEALNRHPS